MKNVLSLLVLVAFLLLMSAPGSAEDKAANKYVGVKTCSMCHKADKTGNQFGIWQKTKHADAFNALKTPKAAEVAKAKGLKTAASEAPECLACHTIVVDAKLADKTFDAKDGVQCEACHGAGSAYKNMAIMKDHAKAVAAGLTDFKDDAAKEKACKTCHNEKSPTYKEFKYVDQWAKIKHLRPKKS
jgi:hypothetical protein